MEMKKALDVLQDEIKGCALCPRLVEWREKTAREKVRRFSDQEYWGRAVPSFGDEQARLLIIGLATAQESGSTAHCIERALPLSRNR
jgi:uracil-DNA glycosylase